MPAPQRVKKQRAELLKSPLDQKRRCKVFLGAASPSGRWEGIFTVGTITRSHATKDTRQAAGDSTTPNISGILFTVVLLFCFVVCFLSALTQSDVVLALFWAAASVVPGNLSFSALLSAHSV